MKPDMGVFAYVCKPVNKIYIGCGKNIKASMNRITFQLNFGNYDNRNLQSDWKLYGAENFEIVVLEMLDYEKDSEKTDYLKDLQALREMVAEKFQNWEKID